MADLSLGNVHLRRNLHLLINEGATSQPEGHSSHDPTRHVCLLYFCGTLNGVSLTF